MEQSDRKEIQEMIDKAMITKQEIKDDIIKPFIDIVNAYHESDLKVIKHDLKMILDQTTKHNSRMSKIEAKNEIQDRMIAELKELEGLHEINCPQADKIRKLEDSQLSQKSIKRWLLGGIGIASGVIGALWMLTQLIGG